MDSRVRLPRPICGACVSFYPPPHSKRTTNGDNLLGYAPPYPKRQAVWVHPTLTQVFDPYLARHQD